MEKPQKRKLAKDAPYAYLQYDKGYNHCWNEWKEYHKWYVNQKKARIVK